MDPHRTPFAGKRRAVTVPAAAAAAKAAAPKSKSIAAAPKPKSIVAARAARTAKRSPLGNANDAPQPRPTRRAFGTVRSSNAPAEKPAPKLQKPSKVSPPPPQKPAKVLPPPLQKHSKLSPPAMQKPSQVSPNPARGTKPSRPVMKPLKKSAPGADLEAKAKKRIQRVSFQVAAVESAAQGSSEKGKASAEDAAGHTPMVAMKATEKPVRVVASETPFFSAQNCSSCTLDQLESAAYWLAQIRIAESVGKHSVAAAFFRLAFECQAQPIHRLQSELRNYSVRHESAGTLAPLFDELLTAHGMLVNQPKFDTDGFEKVDTPLATNVVDEKLDCIDGPVDVGAVIVDKQDLGNIEYPTFERKLDESFEFDDSEAVIVDGPEEANFDLESNIVEMEVPCSSHIVQSECRSSMEKLRPIESTVDLDSSSGLISFDKPLIKLSPGMRSSSSKRLSSGGSTFDKRSPLSSKRLTAGCRAHQKCVSVIDRSSEGMPSVFYNGEVNANVGADDHQINVNQDMVSRICSLVDQFNFEANEPVEDAANNEV